MGKLLEGLLSKLKHTHETRNPYRYAYCYYDTKTNTHKEVSYRRVYVKGSLVATGAFSSVPLIAVEYVNLSQGDPLAQGLGLLLMCVAGPIALTSCAYVVVERKDLFPKRHSY